MTLAAAFADIALGMSAATGAPFIDALILSRGEPEYDAGGSIVPNTGTPVERPCKVQFDACTEAMRAADGYTAKDVRILILVGTIEGDIRTDEHIAVAAGVHLGRWSIESVDLDPARLGWDVRGRRA